MSEIKKCDKCGGHTEVHTHKHPTFGSNAGEGCGCAAIILAFGILLEGVGSVFGYLIDLARAIFGG